MATGDVMNKTAQAAMVTAWAAAVQATALHLHLFIGEVEVNPDTAFGDFTEPEGDWYVVPNVVLDEVWYDEADDTLNIRTASVEFDWVVSDPVIDAEFIGGYFVTLTNNTTLVYAKSFGGVRRMGNALDSIVIPPTGLSFPLLAAA